MPVVFRCTCQLGSLRSACPLSRAFSIPVHQCIVRQDRPGAHVHYHTFLFTRGNIISIVITILITIIISIITITIYYYCYSCVNYNSFIIIIIIIIISIVIFYYCCYYCYYCHCCCCCYSSFHTSHVPLSPGHSLCFPMPHMPAPFPTFCTVIP